MTIWDVFRAENFSTHPFLLYSSQWVKIVFNPRGILKQIRDGLEAYFNKHPEIVSFWKEKLDLYTATKIKGETPEGYRSVLDEAERRFSEGKKVSRSFFQR